MTEGEAMWPFGLRSLLLATAALITLGGAAAKADWCETAPGSQTFTDQNCANQENAYDLGKGRPGSKGQPQRPESLREKLRRALARQAEHERAAQAALKACEDGNAAAYRANIEKARSTGDSDPETQSAYDTFAKSCEAKFAATPPAASAAPMLDPVAEPSDPLEGWPHDCRAAAARLLAGGRKNDGAAAAAAYAALHDSDVCSPYLSLLAGRAGARLPERKMSDRSRRALRNAMSGDAAQLADAIGDRAYDASYDPDEVLNFGMALFGAYASAVGGFHGAPSVRISPRARAPSPAPTFQPRSPTRPSDITGLSR